jgi:DNA polymerase
MQKIHIDFETRSESDIWETGTWVYSTHPSTEILCVCYAIDDGKVQLIDREDILLGFFPEELIDAAKDSNFIFVAHNVFFEKAIWENILVKKYNFPKVPDTRWDCTLARACACSLPKSLEKVSIALNLPIVKDMTGKRIMLKLSKPRRPRKGEDINKAYWYNDPNDFKMLYDYCKTDVIVERELDNILPPLNKNENTIWLLDQKINKRGVHIDREAVLTILKIMKKLEEKLTLEVQELTKGYIDKVSKRARVLNWIEAQGVKLENTQKQTLIDILKTDIPAKVKRVIEIKLQLSKTSTAKYKAMLNAITEDNILRDTLVYHSASTGRWGGKLVQLHNLPRGSLKDIYTDIDILKTGNLELIEAIYEDVMEVVSSCIRGMIVAKEGHNLIVADYSAIEARVLAWLSQDKIALDKYRKGEDLYVWIAKEIYNTNTINKEQRALGKYIILGCGYGMGHSKFRDTCSSYGISIDEAFSKRIVYTYRNIFNNVQKLWYNQEHAVKTCVNTRQSQKCGKVIWRIEKTFLTCELPSGRKLSYFKPKLEMVETPWGEMKESLTYMTVDSQTHQFVRTKTYGGKIVENITQAVARDIMAWSMVRAERKGYLPVLTVHDEIVAQIPERFGSCAEFINILTTPLPWAKDCPITVGKDDCWIGKRYKKG